MNEVADSSPQSEAAEQQPGSLALGLVAFPFLGAAAMAFVIIRMGLPQYAVWFAIIPMFLTTVLVYAEAKRFRVVSSATGAVSPALWAIGLIVMWVLFYPLYMYRRSKFGLANLVWPALIGTALITGMPFLLPASLPRADSDLVVQTLNEMMRKQFGDALVPGFFKLTDAQEIRNEWWKPRRLGCVYLSNQFTHEPMYYKVEWKGASRDEVWVQFVSPQPLPKTENLYFP